MNLREWLNTASDAERQALAEDAGTTVPYLWQLAGRHRAGGATLVIAIENSSKKITPDRVISKAELRPDIFGSSAA